MKKFIAIVASVLAVTSVLVGFDLSGQTSAPDRAVALDGSQFSPGNIISDANFYDGGSMSTDQIQAFLSAQVGNCTSSSCLNVGRYSLNAHGSDAMCGAVSGGASLSAAQIIAQVGAACGISPKVILVTLQKEQALVTGATARNPSAAVLQRAMGYACPDSANGGCDPAYAGVGNQVYWAAWQWKRYGNPAGTSNYFTWFAPGGNRAVQYNPNGACGTKSVYIQNKATAALYYYTPYTPNQAALNNLYGTGDGCSAYGNRNFWRMYTDWFGSTTTVGTTALGSLDQITITNNAVSIRGWAADSSTRASTRVDVYVGGVGRSVTADQDRPDIAKAFPSLGAAHGFSASWTVPGGTQDLCVYAISADTTTNKVLACGPVNVPDGSPFGSLDVATSGPGGLAVRGWAIDPDTAAPVSIRVTVDGKAQPTFAADQSRPDVAAVNPTAGAAHGFGKTLPVADGSHTICVTAVNVQTGSDELLAPCTVMTFVGSTPTGNVDSVTATPAGIALRGWALDGDTTAAIDVDYYVDGVWHRVHADDPRPDLAGQYGGYGTDHGFETVVPVKAGDHRVCTYAVNTGAGSTNPLLGCSTVTVTNAQPTGSVDALTGTGGTVSVRGWALDPDTADRSVNVDVYVDGVGQRLTASGSRPDVAAAFPGAGAAHGFQQSVAASPGPHAVCVYAIDTEGGPATVLACTTVTVTNAQPAGSIDALTGTGGTVSVRGWALDPDTADRPVNVDVYVDGVGQRLTASGDRPDIARAFPGAGAAHGFQLSVAAAPGPHAVCVYAIDSSGGPATVLGCSTVTVVNTAPTGVLDAVSGNTGSVSVRGWALDRDTPSTSINVDVYVDGVGQRLTASGSRADIAAAFPGAGAAHGFEQTVSTAPGSHTVCVYAIDTAGGPATAMGCTAVTSR